MRTGKDVNTNELAKCLLAKFNKQVEHTKKKELRKKAKNAVKANPLSSKLMIIGVIIASSSIMSCGGMSIRVESGEYKRQEALMLNGMISQAKNSPDIEGEYFKHEKLAEAVRGDRFSLFTRRNK